jgi:hypothetical protein
VIINKTNPAINIPIAFHRGGSGAVPNSNSNDRFIDGLQTGRKFGVSILNIEYSTRCPVSDYTVVPQYACLVACIYAPGLQLQMNRLGALHEYFDDPNTVCLHNDVLDKWVRR